jgi:integrase/recombinase XerD
LLRTCDVRTFYGSRDFAIVMLLFDSGIRAAELLRLKDQDVHWDRGLLNVFGKGSKERSVPVSARTLRAIRRYQHRRTAKGYDSVPTLFISSSGFDLTHSGLAQLLRRMGRKTGLHVHPHKFRHSFAVNALRNNAREFDIQACLGHTTLLMTRHYARQSGEDLSAAHKYFSPADRLRTRI